MNRKARQPDAAARLAAAAALARAGDYRQALDELERILEQDPEQAEAYFWRGFCHYMCGHYRHAAQDMDAATLLGCQTAQIWSRHQTGQMEDPCAPEA